MSYDSKENRRCVGVGWGGGVVGEDAVVEARLQVTGPVIDPANDSYQIFILLALVVPCPV